MTTRIVPTTITHLELRPPLRPMPAMPAGLRLQLLDVERIPLSYYRYLYGLVGAPWLWFERTLLGDDVLAAKVHAPGIEVTVLHADGAPAGYFELDFSAAERTDLVYFGLAPAWSGRRIGPWLLGAAVARALARGAKLVTVNTCTLDHPAALPLYKRLGFRPVRTEERRLSVPANIAIPDHIAAGLPAH